MATRCPHCDHDVPVLDGSTLSVACEHCGSRFSVVQELEWTIPHDHQPRMIHQYQLMDPVGSGHFGTVWKSRDTSLDRIVAVKIPRRQSISAAEAELFFREARAVAQLKHPNIVAVHDMGVDGDTVYIVSDFIDGLPLSEWTRLHTLSFNQTAQLCATIADALHHAHENGVVHRDLKPANIMVDATGQPCVMDFGLAKRDDSEVTITTAGQVLGTPAYMSPEQARGDSHDADARSDVFSLGVILYELVTGRRPFTGGRRMLEHQIIHDHPPAPRRANKRVPRDLETICLTALEKSADRRYQTAAAMASDLRRFLRHEPIQARPTPAITRLARWMRRNPFAAASAMLGVAVVGLVAALAYHRIMSPRALTHPVALDTIPADGVQVVFIPLDDRHGMPDPLRASKPAPSPVRTRLEPGDYLVVAWRDDDLFHEVIRRVPKQPTTTTGNDRYSSWKVRDGRIHLPDVTLHSTRRLTRTMGLVEGASEYSTIRDFSTGDPEVHVRIPDYYVDVAEVTYQELADALDDPTLVNAATAPLPVTGLTWAGAVDLAESLGKCLPDEVHLEYLGTAGGTQRYPWGGDVPAGATWTVAPTETLVFDVLRWDRVDREVRGLFSNALEWTLTWGPTLDQARSNRMARGAPQVTPDGTVVAVELGARARFEIGTRATNGRLGLRCVRSVKPRLRPEDFLHVHGTSP